MLVSQHSFLIFFLIHSFSSHLSTVLYYVFLLCFYSDCITVSQTISDSLSLPFSFVTSIGPCPTDRRSRHYSGLRYDPGTLDGEVYPAATYFLPDVIIILQKKFFLSTNRIPCSWHGSIIRHWCFYRRVREPNLVCLTVLRDCTRHSRTWKLSDTTYRHIYRYISYSLHICRTSHYGINLWFREGYS